MTDSLRRAAGLAAPEGLRAMMRRFPSGVAVVTATDLSGRPWGMTCTSICSVTLKPPTLLVSLRVDSPTLEAVLVRGEFSVNLLHEDAQATSELFASGRRDRFDQVDWQMDAESAGPHLPADSHAFADCRTTTIHAVGDHVVVFGEVLRITLRSGCCPLLYGFRQYGRWPGTELGGGG